MCSARGSSRGIFVCGIVLCGAAVAFAQNLQVLPTGWDFGNVAVGTSETMTFDLESMGPTAVWVYVVSLHETPADEPPMAWPYAWPSPSWSLGAFSFNPATYPALPVEHPIGDHLWVDVTFTPPSLGSFSTWLFVHSNDSIDPPGTHAFFLLEGAGVPEAVPAPGAILLGTIGAALVGWLRRHRTV